MIASSPPVPAALRNLAWFNAALLGVLMLALTAYLWPHWVHNPDFSHGFFTPLLSILLFRESRRAGPLRHPRAGGPLLAAVAGLLAAALAGLVAAGLFAVSLGWSHSLVSFALTAAFAVALSAGLAALAAEPLRFAAFNWIALVGAGLWLLSTPLPPGAYSTLSLQLQTWVTGGVLTALHVLGVAARQEGNLIVLAGTTVGVEEACSGIRSLISCVYAGFFFSAFLVHRPWSRALLPFLAAPLAIAMNFARSLTLTLLANAGADIAGFWHNATGFAVLGVTAAVLFVLALLLEPRRGGISPAPAGSAAAAPSSSFLAAAQGSLGGALALAVVITVFFFLHTRPAAQSPAASPDLAAVLPSAPEGWKVFTSADLYRFADALETDHLAQRTYLKGPGGDPVQITVYLAYWPAGRTSVSTVATHTPDACWPGSGWQAEHAAARRVALVLTGGRILPAAEYRFFTKQDFGQHVWFWQLYDGAPITQRDPRSPRELLAIAWRYGFRKAGDQLFVRLSSNRPWQDLANEPLLAEIFTQLRPLGF